MVKSIQSPTGAPHARILGVGGYRASRVVTNEEMCRMIDSNDEWIRTRTGIEERRWATDEETVGVMAIAAGGKALADAGIGADQIGCVLISTVSYFTQTPSLAADVAAKLGAEGAAALDISAACAGFCYGLALAQDMIRSGSAEHVLVIGVERLSDLTDKTDRNTAFLFGDGAGAVVVGPSQTPAIGPVVWGADGKQLDAIDQRFAWDALRDQPDLGFPYLQMKGQQVFRWASYQMVPVAQQALQKAGIDAADLDAFIPHQANMRITDAMVKALKLPAHVPVARDVAQTGNTSAASIPLAMERMLEQGEAPHGGLALLIGFGAGLVYAAQVVVLP
jgi:3-oxoacyl-[acyl-carrier-protein] synthase III